LAYLSQTNSSKLFNTNLLTFITQRVNSMSSVCVPET
jgi:hypothetical protein